MEHLVVPTSFENIEEDWTGLSDQKKRKQLQNRINQRAHRTRKLRAQLATILPDRRSRPARPLHNSSQLQSVGVWSISPALTLHPGTSLSAFEWDVLLFAKDRLWPNKCNPSHWGHAHPSSVSQALGELWSRRMIEVPAMRHSIILVTCLDLEYLTGRDYTAVRLRHANAAIRQIMLGINTPTESSSTTSLPDSKSRKATVSSEDILFAVMALAKQSHSTSLTPSPGTFGLFDPPFPLGLQFLNLWGQHTSNHTHCQAMKQIIQSRNGLAGAGISTPGFVEALYQFDLLESAKTLSQPFSDIPVFRGYFLGEQLKPLTHGHTNTKDGTTRERFVRSIPIMSNYVPLLDILCDIGLYCTWVQILQQRMAPGSIVDDPCPSLVRNLAMLRDAIEHRLLAYVFVENSIEEQLCWTVALIFTHCVIYPLPNRKPLEHLLDKLVASLSVLDRLVDVCIDHRFLLWAILISAMACHSSDETKRQVFLERLRSYAAVLRIGSWSQLKCILQEHLWIDQACDAGGVAVWDMISHPLPAIADIS